MLILSAQLNPAPRRATDLGYSQVNAPGGLRESIAAELKAAPSAYGARGPDAVDGRMIGRGGVASITLAHDHQFAASRI